MCPFLAFFAERGRTYTTVRQYYYNYQHIGSAGCTQLMAKLPLLLGTLFIANEQECAPSSSFGLVLLLLYILNIDSNPTT